MTLLLVVLLISMTFLISMRTFSQRQELFTAPRQTARRAMDYLSYYIRGATDMNWKASSPNAIVTHFAKGNGGGGWTTTDYQASFNNLTGTEAGNSVSGSVTAFGDVGTDIISLAKPDSGMSVDIAGWPGFQHAANLIFNFTEGCPDSAKNLALFKQLTGAHPDPPGSSQDVSNVLMLMDSSGAWAYYQITNYDEGANANCCSPPAGGGGYGTMPGIRVQQVVGKSDGINPPAGHPDLTNPHLVFVTYTAFRVKNGQLQQKEGLFDPTNPDDGFVTLLDNVEDLQIAWIFDDGNIYNYTNPDTGVSVVLNTPGQVPTQAGPLGGTPTATDVTHVVALRVSVVARSNPLGATTKVTKNLLFRPASEDRAAGAPDRSYHYRLTSTLLIRNRALGF